MISWVQNVGFITWSWCYDAGARLKLVLGVFAFGVLLSLFGLRWDKASQAPILCGAALPRFASGRSQAEAITTVLSELFSWGWLLTFALIILPGVLLPLACSFSTSQTLWLRLAGADPRQLAVARAARVFIASAILATLGGAWAVLVSWYHEVPFRGLLPLVLGLAGHVLLSAGFVSVFAAAAPSNRARQVLALVGGLLPVVAYLVYLASLKHFQAEARFWWPYAAPFVDVSVAADSPKHAIACLILGGLLTLVPIPIQFGAVVRPPQGVPREESAVCPGS